MHIEERVLSNTGSQIINIIKDNYVSNLVYMIAFFNPTYTNGNVSLLTLKHKNTGLYRFTNLLFTTHEIFFNSPIQTSCWLEKKNSSFKS